ncbi:MAG: hypothetical protein PHV36_05845, partial [Elusimicrobiales bacterium]|nr:hypothetical protein [Elusimicrobiales bacterium]
MKTLKALVLEIFSVLLLLPALTAAAPALINYQGRLVDANGNPLSGTYSITFNIYGALSGGSAVWTEVQPTIAVDNGIFNAKLGSITNLPPSVFSSDTRYLGVTIGSDAEMSPRVQLLSVPYAIYAASAASVGSAGQGVIISTYVDVAGHVTATRFYGDGSALTGLSVGSVSAASITAGTLPNTVIASSIALNSVQDGSIVGVSGSKVSGNIAGNAANISGNLPAAQIAAGSLPATVIASSVALNSVQDGSIVGVSGSKVSGNISGNAANISGNLPATQIAAGSLPATVIASSVALNSVQDGSIVGVSGSKVSGNIAGNAANISGNLPATQIAAGSLPATVIASSIALNSVQDGSIVGVSGSKVSGNISGSAANISGNLPAAQIAAGSLPNTVIASSIAVNSVQDNSIVGMSVGKLIGSVAVAASNVGAGSLPSTVIASSIALNSVQDGSIVGMSGSKVSGNISGNAANISGNLAATQIAAGSLPATVIASSIAINSVQDGSIVGMSGSKVSGNIAGNAANISGNLAATQIAAGGLPANVIASSLAVNSVYTSSLQDASITKVKIAADSCVNGQILKLAGGVWSCGTDDTGAGGTVTGSGTPGQVAYWSGGSALGTLDYLNARVMLGLTIGTSVQAYSPNLTTYAGIAPSSNIQSLLGSVDYATARTNLGLGALATKAQAANADISDVDGSKITGAGTIVADRIATGNLGASVVASSLSITGFYSAPDIRTNLGLGALATKAQAANADISDVDGSKITGAGTIVADRIATGNLGASVVASSLSITGFYSAPNIRTNLGLGALATKAQAANADISDVDGSKITGAGTIVADRIATGNLGASVVASSLSITGFYSAPDIRTNLGLGALATKAQAANADISDVDGSKITGAGTIVADRIATGNLGASVVASSLSITGFYSAPDIRTNLGLAIGTDVLAPAGSGASLTNLTAANIAAGNLGASVVASSLSISGFYSAPDIRTNLGLGALATKAQAANADISDVDGSKITGAGTIVADRIATGNLGASVVASSLSISGFYSAPNIRTNLGLGALATKAQAANADISDVDGSKITGAGTIVADRIATGNLGASVVASSLSITGFYSAPNIRTNLGLGALATKAQAANADISDVDGSKITGAGTI